MPASSIAQQNYMKLVNAYKKGGLKKSEVSPAIVATAKEMTKKQISDYMVAKKGAPDKAPMQRNGVESSIQIEGITLTDLQEFLKYLESVETEQASMPKYMYIN